MQLLSSDGPLIQLSDAAARQSVTLQGAEDVGDGAPVPVPLLDSGRLQRITALLERTAAAFGLEGMTDDPVGTAASSNPVLTTLVTAVTAAELVDTLNSAEALTVFAPTDCAFAELDEATLQAALDDPKGLLTTVLGFHVIAGEQLSAEDLAGVTELETFTGEILEVSAEGDSVMVGGQATVLVPDIQTANATVHLIDSVMLPPSVG